MQLIVVLASIAAAVPLPAGPGNGQKWIKVNDVEYAVPLGVHPNDYRQQLALSGIAPAPVANRLSTSPTYPLTTGYGNMPYPVYHQLPVYQGPVNYPVYTSTNYAGATTSGHTYSGAPFINYGSNSAVQAPFTVPHINNGAVGPRVSSPLRNSLSQQWVKLREGTNPIEVPAGSDPQQFLESLRVPFRALSVSSSASAPSQLAAATQRELKKKKMDGDRPIITTTKSESFEEFWAPRGFADQFRIPVNSQTPNDLGGTYVQTNSLRGGPSAGLNAPFSSVGKGGWSGHKQKKTGASGPLSGDPIILGGRWQPPQDSSSMGKTFQLSVGRIRDGKGQW